MKHAELGERLFLEIDGLAHNSTAHPPLGGEWSCRPGAKLEIAPPYRIDVNGIHTLPHAPLPALLHLRGTGAGPLGPRASGAEQHLALLDNRSMEVTEEQRSTVHAIRLTRSSDPSEPEPEPNPDSDFGDLLGGCQSAGHGGHGGWSLLVLVLPLVRRRRDVVEN